MKKQANQPATSIQRESFNIQYIGNGNNFDFFAVLNGKMIKKSEVSEKDIEKIKEVLQDIQNRK